MSAKAGPAHAALARYAFNTCAAALACAHVPYRASSDTQIEKAGFGAQRVAIFPYNHVFSHLEAQRLAAWLAAGGRAIFVHALPPSAARVLGLPVPRPIQAPGTNRYTQIELPQRSMLGLPAFVTVDTPWANRLEGTDSVLALGRITMRIPEPVPPPAVYVGPTSAYIACSLHASPPREAGQLLRALICHFRPELWDVLVPRSPDKVGPVESWPDLGSFLAHLGRRLGEGPHIIRAQLLAREAAAACSVARRILAAGDANAAVDYAAGALAAARRAFWMSWACRREELRGVWACNYAKPSWDAAAESLAKANISVVFPYVASAGAAFYRSSVLPPAEGVGNKDWLAEAIRACHAHGIKVHARILGLSCLFAQRQSLDKLKAGRRLMVDVDGRPVAWACPSHPENVRALIAAAVEIAREYDVDGIQLDYFRYPGGKVCSCAFCKAEFEKMLGRQATGWPRATIVGAGRRQFFEFRRRRLTAILSQLRAALSSVRPGLPLSAAVFVNWEDHRDTFGQDWVNWLRSGLIDFACPMNYTARSDLYRRWVEQQRAWVGDRPLCFGIGPFADNVGEFPPLTVARQIQIARANGQGWVLFNLTPELTARYLPLLGLGVTYDPAEIPPWALSHIPPWAVQAAR
ncbi:MAG: family 10 glycosylhydrolase [Armatimonadetes bacterium]|nr:family 10 glycosylhydrolase [Armatimonadota bacterium]